MTKRGHWTPVRNFLIDEAMQRLSGSQFKVFMCLWRKTVGWDWAQDCVSLSQIQEMTGLKSRQQVVAALRFLMKAGLILLDRREPKGNVYRIAWYLSPEAVIEQLDSLVQKPNRLQKRTADSSKSGLTVVRKANTQEERRNKEEERERPRPSDREERVLQGQREKEEIYRRQRLAKLGRRA